MSADVARPTKTAVFAPDLMKDRIVVVTGGGTGLGYSMAEGMGRVGAKLVLAARTAERLDAAVERLRQQGIEAIAVPTDVRDPAQVDQMVHRAVEAFGRIDGLVNNAAGNFLVAAEDLTPGGFDAVVRIVLYGSVHCTLAVGRHLLARRAPGSILSILTPYAWTGSGFVLPSACAKAGVLSMTRSLAVEWGGQGIRLNAIAPGPVPTDGAWKALMLPGAEEQALRRIPMGRLGEHGEIANLAVFLMSDACPYQNGDCVTMDGAEWLAGAGSFSDLRLLPRDQLKLILKSMRQPKAGK